MSVDATRWAWSVNVSSSTKRLILLALADRANEEHTCFPSALRMAKDTSLNRKTILSAISELIDDGYILDTGERKGNGVRVLKLVGVSSREDEIHFGKATNPKIGTSTKIGTTTDPKIGTATDPKIGIQNLKGNLKGNLTKDYSEEFEKFWESYPRCKRKGSKSDAFKTYKKFEKEADLILSVLNKFKLDQSFLKNDGEFIPSPSSWLNKKHWENEFWVDSEISVVEDIVQQPQRRVVVKEVDYLSFGKDLL